MSGCDGEPGKRVVLAPDEPGVSAKLVAERVRANGVLVRREDTGEIYGNYTEPEARHLRDLLCEWLGLPACDPAFGSRMVAAGRSSEREQILALVDAALQKARATAANPESRAMAARQGLDLTMMVATLQALVAAIERRGKDGG